MPWGVSVREAAYISLYLIQETIYYKGADAAEAQNCWPCSHLPDLWTQWQEGPDLYGHIK